MSYLIHQAKSYNLSKVRVRGFPASECSCNVADCLARFGPTFDTCTMYQQIVHTTIHAYMTNAMKWERMGQRRCRILIPKIKNIPQNADCLFVPFTTTHVTLKRSFYVNLCNVLVANISKTFNGCHKTHLPTMSIQYTCKSWL